MRVPHRAAQRSKKGSKQGSKQGSGPGSNHYHFETVEQRILLSAVSAASVITPPGWTGHYPSYHSLPGQPPGQGGGGSTTPQGLTPAQITGAYGAGGILFGSTVGDGAGQTIAIVDAYNDPTIVTDLDAFDAEFNLPNPPSFEKLNDQGLTTPLPGTDPAGAGNPQGTWEGEEALDVEWAHVMAPDASIILFEGQNDQGDELYTTAAAAARTPGVSVVSMSWSYDEFPGETALDSTFTTPTGHEGVTFVDAAGDAGIYDSDTTTAAPQYPDTSPNVISVGGTTLNVNDDTYVSETGWGNSTSSGTEGGSGGGISQYEAQPSYQRFLDTQSSTYRTYPDVAMVADPNSGVPVYDSYDNGTNDPWDNSPDGGTSLATPLFAGLIAVANQGRVINGFGTLNGASETLPRLYDAPEQDFHDITSGDNGYSAGVGYDLVTGRGSPVANLLVPDLASQYIGSYVFSDTNYNGVQDSGETGVAGVTVELISAPTGQIGASNDVVTATTTTDSFGLYEFTDIAAGTYYENFAAPSGYAFSPVGTSTVLTANNAVTSGAGNTALIVVAATAENNFENAGIYQQDITISNASVTRPETGKAPLVFTVTITPANLNGVDVPYTTVDGTATVANNDYQAASGTLVFPAGITSETITVNAIGNTTIENNVAFSVDITVPTGFIGISNSGTGTIINNNFPVATLTGPAAQTRSALVPLIYPFVINLSAAAPFPVSVPYTTVDQSAVAGVDFLAATGTAVFAPGTTSETINVSVYAGTNRQLNKTFLFELTTPPAPVTEVVGTPSEATGTIITNADPAVSSNPASVTESLTGLAYLPFTVDVTPSLATSFTVKYTTSDGTAIAGTDYQAESGVLTFGPGRVSQTVYVPVYREFIPAQQKTLSFTISDPSGPIDLLSPTVTGTINYVSLAALPFSAAQKAIYTDSLNQRVTVSLKGVGSGDVVFLGSVSNATNAYELLVNDTNANSNLTVTVARGKQTSLTNLIVSDPIGTISAKTTNIIGEVSTSSINSLSLGYVTGAPVTISGTNSGQTVALAFNRVLNSPITSAIGIRSLTAGAFVNTTGSPLYITAPSVGVVKVKGTFGGTITTATVESLLVGGDIEGGSILATGSIGSIVAAGISNSTFYAGVAASPADEIALPDSAADFASTTAQIKSVRVTGGVFSNTRISGWTVDSVSIGKVSTDAGGTIFGISAGHVGKVRAIAGTAGKLVKLDDPTSSTSVDNFQINPL